MSREEELKEREIRHSIDKFVKLGIMSNEEVDRLVEFKMSLDAKIGKKNGN